MRCRKQIALDVRVKKLPLPRRHAKNKDKETVVNSALPEPAPYLSALVTLVSETLITLPSPLLVLMKLFTR